jgi:hypothetical protein
MWLITLTHLRIVGIKVAGNTLPGILSSKAFMNTKRWLGTTLLSFQLPAAFGINGQQVKKLTAVEAKSHIGEPYRAAR